MKLLTTILWPGTYFGINSRLILTLVYYRQDILSLGKMATIINTT
jgi:hypothetical protein